MNNFYLLLEFIYVILNYLWNRNKWTNKILSIINAYMIVNVYSFFELQMTNIKISYAGSKQPCCAWLACNTPWYLYQSMHDAQTSPLTMHWRMWMSTWNAYPVARFLLVISQPSSSVLYVACHYYNKLQLLHVWMSRLRFKRRIRSINAQIKAAVSHLRSRIVQ